MFRVQRRLLDRQVMVDFRNHGHKSLGIRHIDSRSLPTVGNLRPLTGVDRMITLALQMVKRLDLAVHHISDININRKRSLK